MDLIIDTTKDQKIRIAIQKSDNTIIERIWEAPYTQAEELLPGIDLLLQNVGASLSDIQRIFVNNKNGTFTALRIGVLTANALAYALNIRVLPIDKSITWPQNKEKFNIVKPEYNKEPNITLKNKKISK